MSTIVPLIATGASIFGAAQQGSDQASALRANSAIYSREGQIAATQGYQQEAQQRRRTAEELGSERAAAGQSGGGYGGSTGRMIGQSALNAELDALNIRYKSQLQKWAYTTQAANLSDEAGTAERSGILRAGAALLKGYSQNYTAAGTQL